MKYDFDYEFKPVGDILASQHRTCGVDAFVLVYLRAERQIRKLLTFLVYQSSAFIERDGPALRQTLHDAKNLSFPMFDKGIADLAGVGLQAMVGADYARLVTTLKRAKRYRDKLFHGQLPDQFVSTAEFTAVIDEIREWCRLLAEGAQREIGYDGVQPDSHRKGDRAHIAQRSSARLPNLAAYAAFLKAL
ncbi:hypothetical protein NKI54_33955 [Mesorhizobium sp. M0663]|uniref:hypothetical protein n=1 Tax=Mesorhizobium sp. M0663 TaxID=2956981 RepID=UPI00333B5966